MLPTDGYGVKRRERPGVGGFIHGGGAGGGAGSPTLRLRDIVCGVISVFSTWFGLIKFGILGDRVYEIL